jgi:hypothetical protein
MGGCGSQGCTTAPGDKRMNGGILCGRPRPGRGCSAIVGWMELTTNTETEVLVAYLYNNILLYYIT